MDVREMERQAFDDHVVKINAGRLRRGMAPEKVLRMIENYVASTPRVIDLTDK